MSQKSLWPPLEHSALSSRRTYKIKMSYQAPPNNNGSKTQNIHRQVDEVVGIMQDNIDKVMEKQERLETLNDKAENLNQGSLQFKRGSNAVRKAMWWKDFKLKIIIGVVILIILAIIITCVVVNTK